MTTPKPVPLVAVVGPTAVGKSALAVHLARRFRGEIINADSRQVYCSMDIGTAKPSPQERATVPHHLYDLVAPDGAFSLALYLRAARPAIEDIHQHGRVPFLVGGTGQYVWGLLEGWQVPAVPPDPALRRRLEEMARTQGAQYLYQELCRVDPDAARSIEPKNVRRVIRALEVYQVSGLPWSRSRAKQPPPWQALVLGLTTHTRAELHAMIDARVDALLAAGWPDEVRRLLAQGFTSDLPSMASMGYRELAFHLQGKLSLEEVARRIRVAHHRLARHQSAWFRADDPRIHWLVVGRDHQAQAEEVVARWLGGVKAGAGETSTREQTTVGPPGLEPGTNRL